MNQTKMARDIRVLLFLSALMGREVEFPTSDVSVSPLRELLSLLGLVASNLNVRECGAITRIFVGMLDGGDCRFERFLRVPALSCGESRSIVYYLEFLALLSLLLRERVKIRLSGSWFGGVPDTDQNLDAFLSYANWVFERLLCLDGREKLFRVSIAEGEESNKVTVLFESESVIRKLIPQIDCTPLISESGICLRKHPVTRVRGTVRYAAVSRSFATLALESIKRNCAPLTDDIFLYITTSNDALPSLQITLAAETQGFVPLTVSKSYSFAETEQSPQIHAAKVRRCAEIAAACLLAEVASGSLVSSAWQSVPLLMMLMTDDATTNKLFVPKITESAISVLRTINSVTGTRYHVHRLTSGSTPGLIVYSAGIKAIPATPTC